MLLPQEILLQSSPKYLDVPYSIQYFKKNKIGRIIEYFRFKVQ